MLIVFMIYLFPSTFNQCFYMQNIFLLDRHKSVLFTSPHAHFWQSLCFRGLIWNIVCILSEICWVSWICRLMSFTKSSKIWSIMSYNIFFYLHLSLSSFWDSNFMYVWFLDIILNITDAFFSFSPKYFFFFLLLKLGNFYASVFTIIDFFFFLASLLLCPSIEFLI